MTPSPNPLDELPCEELSPEAVQRALERAMEEGGPQAHRRWGPALELLQRDPRALLRWALLARRGPFPHPMDLRLEAFASPRALDGAPAPSPPALDKEQRRALVRDLLELPALPVEQLYLRGLAAERPEQGDPAEAFSDPAE